MQTGKSKCCSFYFQDPLPRIQPAKGSVPQLFHQRAARAPVEAGDPSWAKGLAG